MRIVFIGTGEIGVPTLRLLREWREHQLVGIVTQPDKPVGRDQKITPPPIKAATQQLGVAFATSGCELELPVLQPARIKMPEAIEAIRRLTPDVIGLRTNSSARGPRNSKDCMPQFARLDLAALARCGANSGGDRGR
jgi:methionyl-tRNA formyltransferase